jgi:hypothetical protein
MAKAAAHTKLFVRPWEGTWAKTRSRGRLVSQARGGPGWLRRGNGLSLLLVSGGTSIPHARQLYMRARQEYALEQAFPIAYTLVAAVFQEAQLRSLRHSEADSPARELQACMNSEAHKQFKKESVRVFNCQYQPTAWCVWYKSPWKTPRS